MKQQLVILWLSLLFTATACGYSIETLPDRQSHIKKGMDADIERVLADCDDVKTTHQSSEKSGSAWYDVYIVEGCGTSSEYLTIGQQHGSGASARILWVHGFVPKEEMYFEAVQQQLGKTIQFDMDCEDVEQTVLNAVITPARTAFEASVGVKGCEKKKSYKVQCAFIAYTQGKHEITCRSENTSSE